MDKPQISLLEKGFVYLLAIIVDIVQAILDLFVVTEVVNHIIDIAVGALLILYAYNKKLLNQNTVLTFAAVFIGEQIPFFNALPLWTFDVHNLYKKGSSGVSGTTKGVTLPRINKKPLNVTKGIRMPRESRPEGNQDGE